jgi:hypothetical protein
MKPQDKIWMCVKVPYLAGKVKQAARVLASHYVSLTLRTSWTARNDNKVPNALYHKTYENMQSVTHMFKSVSRVFTI